jgi:hypothetical protein
VSDIDIAAMDFLSHGNVIFLHQRRRWRTHCLDCDPAAARPFERPVRADARTGEILTPCPACGRFALAEAPRTDARVAGLDDR